jgi:hypothetical protein
LPRLHELKQECYETTVPSGQPYGIKRHPLHARGIIEWLFHVGERGKLILQPPAVREFHQQRIRRRTAAAQPSATSFLVRQAMHWSSFHRMIEST